MTGRLGVYAFALALVAATAAGAADLMDADAVPNLRNDAKNDYRDFLHGDPHRAFAIGPANTWTWVSKQPSADDAATAALDKCRASGRPCTVYAVDDKVVFDPAAWASLLGPYPSAAAAQKAANGVTRGKRFPNLAFKTADGKPVSMAELRGKVVFVQFWGSWCPPCGYEMPDIQKLYDKVGNHPNVAFVFLQIYEPLGTSVQWMKNWGYAMPVYESGAPSRAVKELALADGGTIPIKQVVEWYPTSWLIDKSGVVLMKKAGQAYRWVDMAPMFLHAAESPALASRRPPTKGAAN